MRRLRCSLTAFLFLFLSFSGNQIIPQEKETVNWITFEQLEDSLQVKPKKVFIDFYTDWCKYCRKMDKLVFTNSNVIDVLNQEYYAVKFDAESDTIFQFGGREFKNNQLGKTRNPVHQIAELLAMRNGKFTPPTMLILDEDFTVQARYFKYLDSESLLKILNN